MATINKQTRDKIVAQALKEIQFARTHKQGKIKNWQKNEDMYYSGRKVQPDTSRANVDLARMQEFVHTLLSKVDNPLTFKYIKRKEAQLKRVLRLNGVRQIDQQRDDWDIKDIVGKKQSIIYGRAIYSYFADSQDGYKAHLGNVDVYDFLVDPSAGGIDLEKAMYLGDYGVVLSRSDLKQGIKDGLYIKDEANNLINGSGNSTESTQEQTNKSNRVYDQNVTSSQKEISDADKYKFWRWGTTFEGQRYYLLLSERGACAIRVQELEEVFKSGLWWYWSWAAFLDLTEFWTPSYCDYVREIFMAQSVSINQMLDNAEQINKPQKVVAVGSIENLAELKYKKDGLIKVKGDIDVRQAFQTVPVASIDTPLRVFEALEAIQEKSSGVTAASKGAADGGGTATIYEGNQANSADRFGLLNKSYAFGYKRFAKLHEWGVREHLTKKMAVEMIGPNGVEIEEITARDIFRKNEDFGILVQASNAETALSESEKKLKIEFLNGEAQNQGINQQKVFEIKATIAGFNEEEIRQLLDVSEFGNAELMSEAERDIERILDGQKIQPNQAATTAYKQRFVDYMRDNEENIDNDQFRALADYVLLLDPVITRNMTRMANNSLLKSMMAAPVAPGAPTPAPGGGDVAPVEITPTPTDTTVPGRAVRTRL